MQAFWFSLAVNLSYFFADIFIKLSSNKLDAAKLIFIRSIYTVTLASIWLGISGNYTQLPSCPTTLELIGCSSLCAVGLYTYIKAVQYIHFVNVAVLGITGAFIHYILGIFLFDEQSNAWFFLAAGLCLLGIIIQWKKGNQRTGIVLALISAITWGFGYALLSIPLQNTNAIWGTWMMEVFTWLGSGILLLVQKKKIEKLNLEIFDWKLILVAGFTILGSYLYNICYQQFSLNVLGFMQLAFFPFALFAGFVVFKEKLSRIEWQGNILVMLGLITYFFLCN